ncbi:MAG: UDP-N-acetylglucosamine--N-acetylmuramyl-(pentapeptide) pyrophosphoryl-undecaprenol N-acetylglucosamine transferase [Rhodothermales bacterium]|jgi:UDP-N-acetylglucosamine--N-acetylmuramyl-(pentapeptide) pyrophosphoryl-undecaprenol N-acetylglucosamine transferase
MSRPPRILMAAGGTGGHVYPAIAVAHAVRRQSPESAVAFAGTTHRMEWEAVPRAGFPIYPITAAALSRTSVTRNFKVPYRLTKGLKQSLRLVGDFDADVVFGAGGFVAGPVGLAGWMRGRPLVLQEQNAFAGLTNRMLGRLADQVHIAFPEAGSAFPGEKLVLSGNPVRAELVTPQSADLAERKRVARARYGLPAEGKVLLVFGGSLGSEALNEALRSEVQRFLAETDAHLIWQTGKRYFERVKASAPETPRVRVLEYLDDMAGAYAAADLAMCRSGASTCAELLVTGTPSILVPSPNVAEDHQTHNARSLVANGSAQLMPEADLKGAWVDRVATLINDPAGLHRMATAATQHAVTDAADTIAASILDLSTRRAA